MPPKKILILAVTFSLIGHALIFSAAGFFDTRTVGQKNETMITINLQEAEITPAAEEKKTLKAVIPSALPQEEAGNHDNSAEEINDVDPQEVTISLDSQDERYVPYLKKIKKKIEYIWISAGQDIDPGNGGISTVLFSIDRGGILTTNMIIASSGNETLDMETLQVIEAAAPYAPFPQDFNLSRLKITADFIYGPSR